MIMQRSTKSIAAPVSEAHARTVSIGAKPVSRKISFVAVSNFAALSHKGTCRRGQVPLRRGKSRKTMRKNFHELRHGKTFARTKRKFGAKRARAQMIAIVLKKAGKSRKRRRR